MFPPCQYLSKMIFCAVTRLMIPFSLKLCLVAKAIELPDHLAFSPLEARRASRRARYALLSWRWRLLSMFVVAMVLVTLSVTYQSMCFSRATVTSMAVHFRHMMFLGSEQSPCAILSAMWLPQTLRFQRGESFDLPV